MLIRKQNVNVTYDNCSYNLENKRHNKITLQKSKQKYEASSDDQKKMTEFKFVR